MSDAGPCNAMAESRANPSMSDLNYATGEAEEVEPHLQSKDCGLSLTANIIAPYIGVAAHIKKFSSFSSCICI